MENISVEEMKMLDDKWMSEKLLSRKDVILLCCAIYQIS